MRVALQARVHRRHDTTLGGLTARAIAFIEEAFDIINEVGRAIILARLLLFKLQRLATGGVGLGARDRAGIHHRLKHGVAAFSGRLCVAVSRVAIRRVDQAGEKGALAERQFVEVLIEINFRRLREAVHGKRAALSEIDVVAIEREDVLFRQPRFKDERHHRFFELAAQRAVAGQEGVLDELLGQRRAALHDASMLDIHPQRAGDAMPVDAVMREEAPVFNRRHRVAQLRRNVGELHGDLLAAVAVAQAGERFAFDESRLEARAALCLSEGKDAAIFVDLCTHRRHAQFARRRGIGMNFNSIAVDGVESGLAVGSARIAALIACAVKIVRQFIERQAVAH